MTTAAYWDGTRDLEVGDIVFYGQSGFIRVTGIDGSKVFIDDKLWVHLRLEKILAYLRECPTSTLHSDHEGHCAKCNAKITGLAIICIGCSAFSRCSIGTLEWSLRARSVSLGYKNLLSQGGKIGYVYLMQDSQGKHKIGRSKGPSKRRQALSSKANAVNIVCLIPREDCYLRLEQQLHWVFSKKRVHGEWFRLTSDDVQYIKFLAGDGA